MDKTNLPPLPKTDFCADSSGVERLYTAEQMHEYAARAVREAGEPLYVVFDGPPGPDSPRFVEVETADAKGRRIGEWQQRADGYWTLGPVYAAAATQDQENGS